MFSKMAHILKRTESLTVQSLLRKFNGSYPHLIEPKLFNNVYKFSDTTRDSGRVMCGQSIPHHFLIEENNDGVIGMR